MLLYPAETDLLILRAEADTAGKAPASGVFTTQDEAAEGGGAQPGEVEVPAKDERSWIQKNWLILLPLGFVVCP